MMHMNIGTVNFFVLFFFFLLLWYSVLTPLIHHFDFYSSSIAVAGSHVILPKDLAKTLPKNRLLTETEWRGIGVQQSRGWQHYAIHRYVIIVFQFVVDFVNLYIVVV